MSAADDHALGKTASELHPTEPALGLRLRVLNVEKKIKCVDKNTFQSRFLYVRSPKR